MMAHTHEIESLIGWQAFRSTSNDVWIAQCDALGLTLEAKTLDDLHSLIPEALSDLLTDLIEEGDLDAFLREKGWSAVDISPLRDFAEGGETGLPWFLTMQEELDDLRRRAA